jgi:alpha-galactosidase
MAKIVIVGAGSGFGGRLSVDIMANLRLREGSIWLVDLNPGRLKKVYEYVQRTVEKYDLPTEVHATTDRCEALPDADFVITSIAVGGGAYWGHPFNTEVGIPREYGVDQSVADTVSVGAVFRFLRTAPVHLQILRDIERLAPNALVLNHTNPMAMLTWVHHAATNVRNVGLCHGVQGTNGALAKRLGLPAKEIRYLCAGINHLAWFLEYKHEGRDLYPDIWALMDDPEKIKGEEVRFEIMKHFGYFPTESNRHDSEYMPYFRRTRELRDHYQLEQRELTDEPRVRDWLKDSGGEGEESLPVGDINRTSNEFTIHIMDAILSDVPYRFNGNVMNHGLISNLPDGCCVEVPCMTDSHGINPCHVGALPAQLAALNRAHIGVQELAVQAVLEKNRDAAYHAVCLCPMTAASVSLPKIREMFDRMWEAEKDLLLHFDPKHTGPVPETCAP